jgi:hypothetical protein
MTKPNNTVGYKNPPKDTQFKPGKSGNPSGRPKGSRNLRTDLMEELDAKIVVTEGGQQRTISKQQALVKAMMAKGMKGDTSAGKAIFNLALGFEQVTSQERISLVMSDDDDAVMQAFKEKVRRDILTEEEPDDVDEEEGEGS